MKKEQAYFLVFIFLLLLLIFLLDFVKPIASGKIEKVSYYPDHVSLYLENLQTQIYFTNSSPVKLEKEMQITVFGKKEESLNKSIIFADKIIQVTK
ncbi:Uncharacterised protein [uncultured archaeon]|nr:Uncharacterised protein [uncultured archaeon]